MKYIYVIAAIIVVFGCKKKDDVPDYASQVAGKYKGTLTTEGNSASDTGYVINISKINDNTVTISEPYLFISQQATISYSANSQDTFYVFKGAALNSEQFNYYQNYTWVGSGSPMEKVNQVSISFILSYLGNSVTYYYTGTKQ